MPGEMMDASLQAARFERVRNAQQTEKAEDYVEMIDDLINAYGEARVVELAKRFGVSHATVNKIVKRLATVYTCTRNAVFFGIATGAILQVMVEVGRTLWSMAGPAHDRAQTGTVFAGFGAGVLVMYATAFLVQV